MIKITSASNGKYKHFKSLLLKKSRRESGEFMVEGIKSVLCALESDMEVTAVIISDKFTEAINSGAVPIYEVPERLFNNLCDTKTPQGIAAVIKTRECAEPTADGRRKYVYCDGVRDPGNMGTIIRTADAAGFDGVIVSDDCADIYAPKTVRASMGSFFAIRLITEKTASDLEKYKSAGFKLIGGALGEGAADYRAADYSGDVIIVVGNEANGISEPVLRLCERVKIPIYGSAESLNASVAAGILMYECARNGA